MRMAPSSCKEPGRSEACMQAATTIRFGQLSEDEVFVVESAARSGVTISNSSATDPLILLKHFGPGNQELGAV